MAETRRKETEIQDEEATSKVKFKKKVPYTLSDVKWHDLELLAQAVELPEKAWMCYGKSWGKLYQLNLIDEDTKPTYFAKALMRYVAGIKGL